MATRKLPSPKLTPNGDDAIDEAAYSANSPASASASLASAELEEERESGEISDDDEGEASEQSFKGYRPEYEWPGSSSDFSTAGPSNSAPPPAQAAYYQSASAAAAPDLRLVVLSTSGHSFLKGKRVAIIHPTEGCSIGRDSAPGPRLRLREMPVSKFHAHIFFDPTLLSWAVVDMGSMHGTFILSPGAAEPVRLSPARTASQPRAVRHGDRLILGSTTFGVHVHQDNLPCEECFCTEEEEIPLAERPKKSKTGSAAAGGTHGSAMSAIEKRLAHRQKMSMLKSSLLTSLPGPVPSGSTSKAEKTEYIDRSAKRRRLYPEPQPRASTSGTSSPSAFPPTPPEPISAPSLPLESTNLGHAMLQKQGWTPGMTLGTAGSNALSEPIVAVGTSGRAGLGAQRVRVGDAMRKEEWDWREEGRQRRFRTFNSQS